jgi:hypothetical protein
VPIPEHLKPKQGGGEVLTLPAMPTVITAADLEKMTFPDPVWLVDGVIPEGVSILAGKPKLGKSFLALNIALALSCGGKAMGKIPVSQRGVLYLSLEDRHRRLQSRTKETFVGTGWPEQLHLCTEWPRIDQGAIPLLQKYLNDHPKIRVIVVDVLAKIKARKKGGNSNPYDDDYQAMEPLIALTQTHDVSLIILHHTRKLVADDPLDELSGSTGLTGSADTILVLKKAKSQAVLYVRGRDVEEQELALNRDPSGGWMLLGKAQEVRMSEEQKLVLEALKKGPSRLMDIVKLTGKNKTTVYYHLDKLMGKKLISQRENGLYEMLNYTEPPEPLNCTEPPEPPELREVQRSSVLPSETPELANEDIEPVYSQSSVVQGVQCDRAETSEADLRQFLIDLGQGTNGNPELRSACIRCGYLDDRGRLTNAGDDFLWA